MKRRLYLILDATTTGPAHGLVKTMVMVGFVSRLELSQEYDTMRGMDRTVASQRIMNPEASQTKEQSRLQLPICEATVDECETRYQTKWDTTSKMTALKILISPKVTGEKFTGAEYEQDEN